MAHNRDEALSRGAAEFPRWHSESGGDVFFALDRLGGGSWMAANRSGRFVYLLNGGRKHHRHEPPYRMSRGRIPIEIAQAVSVEAWAETFDPTGIEPFTSICFDREAITEFVWDGSGWVVDHPEPPFIRASWTLYDLEAQQLRKLWLAEWLETEGEPSCAGQWDFHSRTHSDRPEIDMLVDRSFLKTIAVSQFAFESGRLQYRYRDLTVDSELECALG